MVRHLWWRGKQVHLFHPPSHVHSNSNADCYTHPYCHSDSNANRYTHTHCHRYTGTNSHADTDWHADTNRHHNLDTHKHSHSYPKRHTYRHGYSDRYRYSKAMGSSDLLALHYEAWIARAHTYLDADENAHAYKAALRLERPG